MALAQEDIEQIQNLIRNAIAVTPEVGNANVRYELDLRERTIRVEEELKHQRELMLTGFAQMEKRFEQMEKRFEQVDKQLEQQRIESEKRFAEVDKQFEQVDKQFVQQRIASEKRFEQIDKQLEKQGQAIMDIHQEIKLQMRWSFGILLGVGGLVVGVLKVMA